MKYALAIIMLVCSMPLAQAQNLSTPGWFTGNMVYNLCRGYSIDGKDFGFQYEA
jgi:hypothetical protein